MKSRTGSVGEFSPLPGLNLFLCLCPQVIGTKTHRKLFPAICWKLPLIS